MYRAYMVVSFGLFIEFVQYSRLHIHEWCIHVYERRRQHTTDNNTLSTRKSFKQILHSSRISNDEEHRPKHFIVAFGVLLIAKIRQVFHCLAKVLLVSLHFVKFPHRIRNIFFFFVLHLKFTVN